MLEELQISNSNQSCRAVNLCIKLLKCFFYIRFKVLLIEFDCLIELHKYGLHIDFVYGLF
jgi:hypothetical protein